MTTFQNLTKSKVPPGFRGNNKIMVQAWYLVDAFLYKPSPHFMNGWRKMLLRIFGAKIGVGVIFRPSSTITYPWNLSVANNSYIGDEVVIYNLDQITIGSHVSLSFRSFLCAGSHDPDDQEFSLRISPIIIEDEVWIAADCFVGPGVTLEKGVVLGARSTFPGGRAESGGIYVGSPAKFIRKRYERAARI